MDSRRNPSHDEVDRAVARHATDDSFESWFAALMNRNRNNEEHINIGGNIRLPDDKHNSGMLRLEFPILEELW